MVDKNWYIANIQKITKAHLSILLTLHLFFLVNQLRIFRNLVTKQSYNALKLSRTKTFTPLSPLSFPLPPAPPKTPNFVATKKVHFYSPKFGLFLLRFFAPWGALFPGKIWARFQNNVLAFGKIEGEGGLGRVVCRGGGLRGEGNGFVGRRNGETKWRTRQKPKRKTETTCGVRGGGHHIWVMNQSKRGNTPISFLLVTS